AGRPDPRWLTMPASARTCRRPYRLALCVGGAALAAVVAVIACARPAPEEKPSEPPPADAPAEPAYAGPAWFQDVTAQTGITATSRNGEEADQFTMLESLGTGVAVFDYDGDGRPDIFVVGGGYFDGPDK